MYVYLYFLLIINFFFVIFCVSLRLVDIFCVKIVFINYIFLEDDYNYYCLFFYVIVKVMFLLSNEVF